MKKKRRDGSGTFLHPLARESSDFRGSVATSPTYFCQGLGFRVAEDAALGNFATLTHVCWNLVSCTGRWLSEMSSYNRSYHPYTYMMLILSI